MQRYITLFFAIKFKEDRTFVVTHGAVVKDGYSSREIEIEEMERLKRQCPVDDGWERHTVRADILL